jgi:hypothetical protein
MRSPTCERGAIEALLRGLTGDVLGREVDEHQVVVGATRDDPQAAPIQRRGERPGIVDDRPRISLELRLQRLAERHRLGGDDVDQRPALHAGEHRAVDLFGNALVVAEDHA